MKRNLKIFQESLVRSVINTRIYDLVRETPLTPMQALSAQINNRVLIKREDLQPVFSFKIRGAYHKMTRLSPARLKNGVIAASAGNHAQGVALAAKKLGCRATIFMPRHAQRIKVDAVRSLGAEVVLTGETFDDSNLVAQQRAKKKHAVFIPPFDDKDIIAGNGTIAAEILRQHPDPLQAIFCAIGGGGLITGVAAYVKALRPEVRIIGIEAEESASMRASLDAGKAIQLPQVGAFADAVAVKKPGQLPFAFARDLLDDVIVVNNDALCAAVKDLYEDTRVVFEPGGALAIAGLKHYVARRRWRRKNLIALASGANMNFERLRFIAERAEVGEQHEALFAVTIPERVGSFRHFCELLGQRNITEFNYRMDDLNEAHIFVGVEIHNTAERRHLFQKMRAHRLPTIDLTDDEMAKTHIRHMVGGRAPVANELLYRFEYPEKPGALMNFLNTLGQSGFNWNISLFHYRNNGADAGRVLVGMQVPPAERSRFRDFLRALGYPYVSEENNPIYRLFLEG